ncbi:phage tail length tape measure family protein [Sphingomonas hylomeconis]|uniref:Phage tail length tape measure family protein n=1 Tax=Sphingomonas hylomeconis TaxID=1395958 RepID=A0ABV7SSF7_9SPHN|nr:phage tail length tape measure family protein [Sphingomonas hylomeconis]
MPMKSVGFRLHTDGKAEVKNDFREVGAAGKAAMNEVAEGAEQSATRAAAATDALTERQMAAYRRQAAQAKVAAAQAGVRSQFDAVAADRGSGNQFATVNLDRSTGAARQSAAVFEAAALAEEHLANAAMKLRAAIDPAYAGQARYNSEMAEARTLIAANAISLDDYCTKLRIESGLLQANTAAHRLGASSAGAQRAAMQGLSFQLQDVFTQLSMGANPIQVVAIQGGQLAGQFANLESKAGAVARFMIGPWGLALTAGALVLAPFIGKLIDSNSALDDAVDKLKKDAAETEVNRKAKERFALSTAGVSAAIRDQEAALDATAKSSKTAAEQDSETAAANLKHIITTRELTVALLARAKAEYAASQSMLNPNGGAAQYVYANRLAEIQAQAKQADADLATARRNSQSAMANLADENARRSLDPVEAIKRSYDGPAGLIAKAKQRLIAEGATRAEMERQLGILRQQQAARIKAAQETDRPGRRDGETLTAAAVAKMLRDAIPGVQVTSTTGGKHVPNSYHYKSQAVDFVPAGGMASMDKADVRRLFESRGIDVVELLGPGDKGHSDHFHVAWTKGKLALDEFSDAAKRAQDRERDIQSLTSQFDPAKAAADDYQRTLAKIAATHLDPATAARYAEGAKDAFIKARAAAFSLPSVEGYRGDQTVEDERLKQIEESDRRRQEYIQQFRADQGAALAYSQAELDLVGASDTVREAILSKLQLANELMRNGVDIQSAEGQALIGIGAQIDANNARLKVQAAAWDEVRGFGSQFAETVLSEDTWSSWGNAGKTILNELKSEFIKLALLNPLKNMINGNDALPTLTSIFTSFAGAGRNAVGTENWSGGMTWVAENGPELINLPAGSKVTSAADTRRMLAGNDNRPMQVSIDASIHAPGASAEQLAVVAENQRQMAEQLPGRVIAIMNDAKVRGQA